MLASSLKSLPFDVALRWRLFDAACAGGHAAKCFGLVKLGRREAYHFRDSIMRVARSLTRG